MLYCGAPDGRNHENNLPCPSPFSYHFLVDHFFPGIPKAVLFWKQHENALLSLASRNFPSLSALPFHHHHKGFVARDMFEKLSGRWNGIPFQAGLKQPDQQRGKERAVVLSFRPHQSQTGRLLFPSKDAIRRDSIG